MNTKEFIDIICPNHDRTSCSDDNIANGFYANDDMTISSVRRPRCARCALLEIENGTVHLTKENIQTIREFITI